MNNNTNNYANIWSAPEHAPVQLFSSSGGGCPTWMKGMIRGLVKGVANDKLAPAFDKLNATAASLKNKTKFTWDGFSVLKTNKTDYGVYMTNSGVEIVQSYEKKFDGWCSSGKEIRMFDGNGDNPGSSYDEKLSHCAAACLQKKPPKSGSWDGFAAEGFVMDPNGRCYCQSGESKSCKRDTRYNYKRFDFNSKLCAKEIPGKCQNMLQHQFVLHDTDIDVSNDCKKVNIHFGIPIMMRDTFTAGAVYPNPEIPTVLKNCGLEIEEAAKYAGCKLANTAKSTGKWMGCLAAWLVPCGTAATGQAFGDLFYKHRSVDYFTEKCQNDHCGSKPVRQTCTKAKIAGKEPNYWCNRKDTMQNKLRSEISVKPTVSAIIQMGIDVDVGTQKMKMKDRTVHLLSNCQVKSGGSNKQILEDKCSEQMDKLKPILKKQIEGAIAI